MASVTLEELLEKSGISALGGDTEKTASVNDDQPNLVSALRKYAESTEESSPDTNVRAAARQELIEKTAEILVIRQAIEEIEKVASFDFEFEDEEQMKVAAFIKAALDKGHEEAEIAKFIKQAFGGRILRKGKEIVQAIKRPFQRSAERFAARSKADEVRLLKEKIAHGSPDEVRKYLKTLEVHHGKETVTKTLQNLKNKGVYLPQPAMKYLPKGGTETYKFTTPGGKKHEIAKAKAHKYLGIGGGVAGGAAVASAAGGRKRKKDSNVTVVST